MTSPAFAIERGAELAVDGRAIVITHVLDLEYVMAQDPATGRIERVAIMDLRPRSSDAAASSTVDLSEYDGEDWDEAKRRLAIVNRVLALPHRSRSDVVQEAQNAGVEVTTVYRWLRTYRNLGTLASLLPVRSSGGRGKPRISKEAEAIVSMAIEQFYLQRQQRSVRATAQEVIRLCRDAGVAAPHPNTVRARILTLAQATRLRRRGHGKTADDRLTPRPDHFEDAQRPLAIVQIDHTKLDIVVVDELHRMPVGRPWITLAFDVFSRMVVGFSVSLEPPGAHSTGLCLAHAILPKEAWLAKRNVTTSWPCWGFPAMIHLDNAKEFRGEMLRRACEQYGIEINFRPVATPHFGAHIERMLGTLATALHDLPGTTFSNPRAKGDYNSEALAALTVAELESYIAEYIASVYHQRLHTGIDCAPIKRWTDAILGTATTPAAGTCSRPTDEERIRLDFLPVVERTIQNYGVRIDEINYYSDVLRPYIGTNTRGKRRSFIFRRDPGDISRVYFWDPEVKQYSVVPYRDLTHPPMTVWELRELRRRLIEEGLKHIDEAEIFAAYARLQERTEMAVNETKRVRRARAAKAHRSSTVSSNGLAAPRAPQPVVAERAFNNASFVGVVPFDVDDV